MVDLKCYILLYQHDGNCNSLLLISEPFEAAPQGPRQSETGVYTVHGATVRTSHGGSDYKLSQVIVRERKQNMV